MSWQIRPAAIGLSGWLGSGAEPRDSFIDQWANIRPVSFPPYLINRDELQLKSRLSGHDPIADTHCGP
jgi:hypothetical protein